MCFKCKDLHALLFYIFNVTCHKQIVLLCLSLCCVSMCTVMWSNNNKAGFNLVILNQRFVLLHSIFIP